MQKPAVAAATAVTLALGVAWVALPAFADPPPVDCWEKVFPDQATRTLKRQELSSALARIDTKSNDTNLPQDARDYLKEACKKLLEKFKDGSLCPACLEGSHYGENKSTGVIVINKTLICPPGLGEPHDPNPELGTTLVHEYDHSRRSGPLYEEMCKPYKKFSDAIDGVEAAGVPAKPAAGTQAEKEMQIMAYIYRAMIGIDEALALANADMRLGPKLEPPLPTPDGEAALACSYLSAACANLDGAEAKLASLPQPAPGQSYTPAVSGFDKTAAEAQVKKLRALKTEAEEAKERAETENPGVY